MKYIKLGIAYEGGSDVNVIHEIAKNIFDSNKIEITDCPETPATGLLGYIRPYVKKFEEIGVDLIIFCTDQDKDAESRRDKIRKIVEDYNPVSLEKVAIAVPKPHIEAWLLLQDEIIKNLLSIDGARPLPFKDLPPKQQLMSIFEKYNEKYMGTFGDFKIDIAKRMNIEQCQRKSSEFKQFVDDLRECIARMEE